MDVKGVFVILILVMAGCLIAGCNEKEGLNIVIINRPYLNLTASEVHISPGESFDLDFWWETEGRQEWPDAIDFEFIMNNSRNVGEVEGYGQKDNITTDEREPSFKYSAFDSIVGRDKLNYFIIIYYDGEYFNSTGFVWIYVEKEFNDIPIKINDRYYRAIEDIIGTADDDLSKYSAMAYFSWPKVEGAHVYEMTVHFNGNNAGDMFWYDPPRPFVYSDGDTNERPATANMLPEGELKGRYVGLEDIIGNFMISLGGPSIEFEDGEWEQSEIDSIIAENRTKAENYFQGWTADVKVVPDDRYF